MEHPYRSLPNPCCEWKGGKYIWRGIVKPCNWNCAGNLHETAHINEIVNVKYDLAVYMSNNKIRVYHFVMDLTNLHPSYNKPNDLKTYVPKWLGQMFKLGSRMR